MNNDFHFKWASIINSNIGKEPHIDLSDFKIFLGNMLEAQYRHAKGIGNTPDNSYSMVYCFSVCKEFIRDITRSYAPSYYVDCVKYLNRLPFNYEFKENRKTEICAPHHIFDSEGLDKFFYDIIIDLYSKALRNAFINHKMFTQIYPLFDITLDYKEYYGCINGCKNKMIIRSPI